ncbi:hypothetical protein ACFQX6_13350 [Streptosporangium lutulentum]
MPSLRWPYTVERGTPNRSAICWTVLSRVSYSSWARAAWSAGPRAAPVRRHDRALYSIASVGSLAGALTAAKIAARIGQGPAIRVPIAIAAPFQLLTPMAQPGWLLWVAAFAYLVISCCVVVNNVTQVGFRQRLTPEHLLGRMNATMRFLVWGTTPIGALIGVLGQLLGPPPHCGWPPSVR